MFHLDHVGVEERVFVRYQSGEGHYFEEEYHIGCKMIADHVRQGISLIRRKVMPSLDGPKAFFEIVDRLPE